MKKRSFGLDLVRSCAIIPVMAEHFLVFALRKPPAWIYALGAFGVGIFFVLSGFLIGGIILRQFTPGIDKREIRTFYMRRWMRTLPLYWVFFFVAMFVGVAGVELAPEFNATCLIYLLFLQNLFWPIPVQWYQESWSLAVEEWFYLLFPLLFIAMPLKSTLARVTGVAAIMTAVPLALRAVVYIRTSNADTALWAVVVLHLDSIAIGIFAAVAQNRLSDAIARFRLPLCFFGLLATVLSYGFCIGWFGSHPWFAATLWPVVTAICVAMTMLGAHSINWRIMSATPIWSAIIWISTRSYALYLCHGAIIRLMLGKGYMWKGLGVSLPMFVFASIIAAELAHRLVERPIMRRRPIDTHRPVAGMVDTQGAVSH